MDQFTQKEYFSSVNKMIYDGVLVEREEFMTFSEEFMEYLRDVMADTIVLNRGLLFTKEGRLEVFIKSATITIMHFQKDLSKRELWIEMTFLRHLLKEDIELVFDKILNAKLV